jgi:hypothetical protein
MTVGVYERVLAVTGVAGAGFATGAASAVTMFSDFNSSGLKMNGLSCGVSIACTQTFRERDVPWPAHRFRSSSLPRPDAQSAEVFLLLVAFPPCALGSAQRPRRVRQQCGDALCIGL